MKVLNQKVNNSYSIYHGDSCEVMKGITDNSIHYSIFSPPFSSLFTFSNSDRDMGNSKDDTQFYKHIKFLVSELYRVLMPGRLVSFHCIDTPLMKSRDGVIGLKDFPGELIRLFTDAGFIYHSKVTIWKDPLVEATRTKAIGLLHKQIVKDSAMCRQGMPDYLVTMRKPGENPEPIAHPDGLSRFFGENEPVVDENGVYSHQVWKRYASPVWMDIRQSNTLNAKNARAEKDERHISPLQLDVIARAIELWSNPGDIVFTPFLGIGSEAYQAILMGRRAMGIELKESYFNDAVVNCDTAVCDYFLKGIE